MLVSLPVSFSTTAPVGFSVEAPETLTSWKQYVPGGGIVVVPLVTVRSPVAWL